jgi:competence protein ComEC
MVGGNIMKKTISILLISIVIFLLVISFAFNTLLKVSYIDVGKGDSVLIQLPSNKVILIDGGPKKSSDKLLEYLSTSKIKRIDYLFVTHTHEDHIGGLPSVIDKYSIGEIYMPKASSSTKKFKKLLSSIKNKGLKIKDPKAGSDIINDKLLGITLRVLSPYSSNYENPNDNSVVLKLNYKTKSFLFAGDASSNIESELLKSNENLKADILKVGHHGSKHSSSIAFLRAVKPMYSIISVDKDNNDGLPDPNTLEYLTLIKSKVYRTDLNGTILAVTDGKSLKVSGNK